MDELQNIQSKIYVIRGQRVMLDRDIAKAYGVETKALNQAVKRNIKRFEGEDYMFQLTKEECLRSQIVTLNEAQGRHLKYMPYAMNPPVPSSMLSAPPWQSCRPGPPRASPAAPSASYSPRTRMTMQTIRSLIFSEKRSGACPLDLIGIHLNKKLLRQP